MDLVVEDPLSSKSVALETEAAVSTISPEMTNPTALADELEVPIVDLPMEPS